ncbi:hypothetical protein CNR22_00860 [Sphingobacteriaceae bacterium]|nr:hypothetical protein CNR22_00860 [Sphingobacteriaceae bacterium]
MKKKLLNLCLFLSSIFTASLSAQVFSAVGTGTTYNTNTSFPSPYGNFWWGARHQMFITAAELSAAGISGGAQINTIGFNIFSTNSAANHVGWNVKVYTTSSTDPLLSGWVSTGLVAQTSPITATGTTGWNQTALVTPFIWNGADNLVIETCFNNSSYTYNYSTYWTTNLSGTSIKTRWRNADISTNCTDPSTSTSATTRPNIRFEWINPTPCSGTPAANSIITPTFQICPNSSANLSLANNYTVGGLTYAWYASSTSSVGPFTQIPGINPVIASPNLTTSTYFQAVITCTVSNITTTASVGMVTVSPVITSNVPYYEGFEGITSENKLPNCSWSATNLGSASLTYTSSNTLGRIARTGTKFASFYYSPAGVNHFYTNGIYLNAGITYSAALWYETEYYGYTNWSDLSILYGAAQSTTGLISIANSNGPAVSNIYKSLSNTFTVATSGLYYVAIRATSGSGSAQYLTWDDLSITIPCSFNAPSMAIATNSTVICSNSTVSLTASGADSYTWSTGSTDASLNEMPAYSTTYEVVGTNSLSGCTTTVSQMITVNPQPEVYITTNSLVICPGKSANLIAVGNAITYNWVGGASGAFMSVSPSVTTVYTVTGTNGVGCTASAMQTVTVLSAPNVSISGQQPMMCAGETQTLTADGGLSYQWISSGGGIYQGSSIIINPVVNTVYTVTGSDANGCINRSSVTQNVSACLGLKDNKLSALTIYPNPTSGDINISTQNGEEKVILVSDVMGKLVYSGTSTLKSFKINISHLSKGIYYVKIQSDNTTEVVKVVKN